MAVMPRRYRFTVDEYERLAEIGVPSHCDRVELLEVMDTSAAFDRRVKLPLYARAGIIETWVLDLTTSRIAVCRNPGAARYAETRVLVRGDELAPAALPDLRVTVEDLLG
jgi:Uma2 family endonuclease